MHWGEEVELFFCIRARVNGRGVQKVALKAVRDFVLLDPNTPDVSFPLYTVGDDQTLPLLQLPGQPAIQFVPQVIEGGKRGKAQDLSAGFLQIGIGPKPTARPVRDELQKDLHQGLLVVGEAFSLRLMRVVRSSTVMSLKPRQWTPPRSPMV